MLDLNTVLNRWLQVKYVNPLLYSVNVSDCPSPECGVLCILIGDLNIEISQVLFYLLGASKPFFNERPVIG